jgi:integrase/recombinase XerD
VSAAFRSTLAEELEQFLQFKRALGLAYARGEFTLRSFDRFLHDQAPTGGKIDFETVVTAWIAERPHRKAISLASDLTVVRQFFLFRRRHEPGGFVPARSLWPSPASSGFVPHVYSAREIRTLLDATTTHIHGPQPFYGHTIRTLILMLYCTGLRFGEPIRLRVADVDLLRRLFVVRETKGKTRLVPFRPDLGKRLRDYRRERDRVALPSTDTFLVQPSGRPYGVIVASTIVRRLLRRTGLKPPRGRVGPRPYDFRATFAVHRLTRWYRSGIDVPSHLPWLSAYMGHVDLLGTEVYLKATAELLAITSERLRAQWRAAAGTQQR